MKRSSAPRLHRVSVSLSDMVREDLNDLAELLNQPVAELIFGLVYNALQEPTFREMIREGKARRVRRALDAETARTVARLLNQAH
jgi:hypothetical protein